MSSPAGTRTLGVVGHVDHGKTALVRALTGIETDRLAEERERGLSIVLGFAHFELDGGGVDLIDVPGHEAFIRAMVAGATGFDGILLVVAANEGVRPQTREHFAIARLLDLRCGVVVVTKADLVDTAALAAVRADVAELVAGTFLQTAPVVAVSAVSGQGIPELRSAIAALPARVVDTADPRPFCLPLDRVFTMRGFGVVGTGTVRSGRIAVADAVVILPRGVPASVRGLQRHGEPLDAAAGGQRVAVNLRGVDRDQVARGDVVTVPGALAATERFDALLELLPDAESALRNGASLRLLIGTTDVAVKLRLLETRELAPGAAGLAQLRCGAPVVCQRGERFIVRSDTPSRTQGGGRVIEPHAPRRRRFDAATIESLRRAGSASAVERLSQMLESAGTAGVGSAALCAGAGVSPAELEPLMRRIDALEVGHERWLRPEAAQRVLEEVRAALKAYHAQHPLRRGMSVSELGSRLQPLAGADVLRWALDTLRARSEVGGSGDRFHVTGFDPLARLSATQRKLAAGLADQFRRGGIEPPAFGDIEKRGSPLLGLVNLLLETGELVKLQTTDRDHTIALHAEVLEDVRRKLGSRYPYPAQFAVKDARDLLGSTRKFVVPVLEHLDATGFTLRIGDLRQLRNPLGGE